MGRREIPPQLPGQGTPPGRRDGGASRSGEVQYGTESNMAGRVQVNGLRIERAPQSFGNMQQRVMDQERVGLVYNGYRVGYYHYDRSWRDDWFFYPFYAFNPWQQRNVVCSPWYYYPTLPPYIHSQRIIIIQTGWPSQNWSGNTYRWNQPTDRWGRYNELDYAVDDIVQSFERRDYRSVERVIPRRGNVHIYMDGRYSYSLHPDDFYDLYVDGIENARTVRYEIVEVRQSGRTARVTARHQFVDPWNQRSTTYHDYFLEQEGRDYVIREFGTTNHRNW
jgi:hypothetical protein